jgi:integrating conjugative element protein (TIGR03765 family)
MLKKTDRKNCLMTAVILLMTTSSFAVYADNDYSNLSNNIEVQQKASQLKQKAVNTIQNLQSILETSLLNAATLPTQVDFSPYPINSTLLSPALPSHEVVIVEHLMQPIFLVGADNFSIVWLQQYIGQLQALHATGFLVQAQSAQDADPIIKLTAQLPLVPLSGDIFAKQWGITHYPVLLMPKKFLR